MVRKKKVNRCAVPRWVAVFFGVMAAVSLLPLLMPDEPSSTGRADRAMLVSMFTFSCAFWIGMAGYVSWNEITWDNAGLTIRRGLRRRSCRWEEVVDFYETYEPRGLVIVGDGVVRRVLGQKSADGVDELREVVAGHCSHLPGRPAAWDLRGMRAGNEPAVFRYRRSRIAPAVFRYRRSRIAPAIAGALLYAGLAVYGLVRLWQLVVVDGQYLGDRLRGTMLVLGGGIELLFLAATVAVAVSAGVNMRRAGEVVEASDWGIVYRDGKREVRSPWADVQGWALDGQKTSVMTASGEFDFSWALSGRLTLLRILAQRVGASVSTAKLGDWNVFTLGTENNRAFVLLAWMPSIMIGLPAALNWWLGVGHPLPLALRVVALPVMVIATVLLTVYVRTAKVRVDDTRILLTSAFGTRWVDWVDVVECQLSTDVIRPRQMSKRQLSEASTGGLLSVLTIVGGSSRVRLLLPTVRYLDLLNLIRRRATGARFVGFPK